MKRDFFDYIDDIIQSAEDAEMFIEDLDYSAFSKDKKTINAVIRSLEVMGEAAKKIPARVKKQFPDIPWKEMSGIRNKLIHEYFGVDLEIIWNVLKEELPAILPLLKDMKRDIITKD